MMGPLHINDAVVVPEAELDAFRDWLAGASAGTAAVALGGEAYESDGARHRT